MNVNSKGKPANVAEAARSAASVLSLMGVPLLDGGNWSAGSLFEISGESAKSAPDGIPWADYYLCGHDALAFGVHKSVDKLLSDKGLYAEWINPGVLGVYSIN